MYQYCGFQPGVREHILQPIETKHRDRLNLEPALILALTKVRPRIELLNSSWLK
jgi:hypothetical protein